MGVEGGIFSPLLRSPSLREQALCALGLDANATLLIGVGRFSAEKRWNMVMRAVGEVGASGRSACCSWATGRSGFGLELLADRIPPCCGSSQDHRPRRACAADGQRRRAGAWLRGRDFLHCRRRSAGKRNSADRSRPRSRASISSFQGADTVFRAGCKCRSSGLSTVSSIAGPSCSGRRRSARANRSDHGRAFRRTLCSLRSSRSSTPVRRCKTQRAPLSTTAARTRARALGGGTNLRDVPEATPKRRSPIPAARFSPIHRQLENPPRPNDARSAATCARRSALPASRAR